MASQTLNLLLLAIFQHSPPDSTVAKAQLFLQRSGDRPLPPLDNMSGMWTTTNTHSDCESHDEDGNDGPNLMYGPVSGLFKLYGVGF